METKTGTISVATAVVLMFGILFLGPAACISNAESNVTERVKAACAGDLNDAARASACTLALTQKGQR